MGFFFDRNLKKWDFIFIGFRNCHLASIFESNLRRLHYKRCLISFIIKFDADFIRMVGPS